MLQTTYETQTTKNYTNKKYESFFTKEVLKLTFKNKQMAKLTVHTI